jgi:hypothetical protein
MSFGIYIVGFIIVIGGLIYAAVILHLAMHWIVVGTLVLLGIAIVKGVSATRQKDAP